VKRSGSDHVSGLGGKRMRRSMWPRVVHGFGVYRDAPKATKPFSPSSPEKRGGDAAHSKASQNL
jgi:hypothetical protein